MIRGSHQEVVAKVAIGLSLGEMNLILIGHCCLKATTEDGAVIVHPIADSEVVHRHQEDGRAVEVWNAHRVGETVISVKVVHVIKGRWTIGKL